MNDRVKLKTAEIQHNHGNTEEAKRLYSELLTSENYNVQALAMLAQLEQMPSREASPYVVVWQTGKHGAGSIVRRLISSVPIAAEFDDYDEAVPFGHLYSKIYERMIVVDHRINSVESLSYYLNCRKMGAQVVLIHLSDENFSDFHEVYGLCSMVYRQYWGGLVEKLPGVQFLPLGDDSAGQYPGINAFKPAADRSYPWNFLGDNTKQDRRDALDVFSGIEGGRTHLVNDFFDPNKLGPAEYREILANSVFTLCPMGYSNADTFRFWEAIEFGSVPLFAHPTRSDYFSRLLGQRLPVPVFTDWPSAFSFARLALAEPSYLAKLQQEMISWWVNVKNSLPRKFAADLANSPSI